MKYIGTVLYGIVEIIILIAILSFPATSTESLIITIIVLTYITVRSIGAGLAQSFTLIATAFDHELTNLKGLLGHSEENPSEYKEEIEKKIKKNQIKFYIQLVIILILYVIIGLLMS
jgi:hypothetical protein